jgi:hypothetical protein
MEIVTWLNELGHADAASQFAAKQARFVTSGSFPANWG